ncbi:MAG TPA: ankyrin repeat domain-containing protein [Opitutaceae bacterium]|jgi:hypothetical protein
MIALALLSPGCAGPPAASASAAKQPKVAEIDRRDGSGRTQLIRAARKGHVALMGSLLAAGAKTDIQDGQGFDALMYIVDDDTYRNDAVALLLEHHADANLVNADGNSALIIAASKQCDPKDAESQYELIKLLLDAGADADATSLAGLRPLHLAAAAGQPGPCIDLLLKATSKDSLLARDHGYSAMSEAALNDQRPAEDFLIGDGLEPQDLPPLPSEGGGPESWPPQIDDTFAINARSFEAYGDYLQAHGRPGDAHGYFVRSSSAIPGAVSEYQGKLDRYKKALAKEKAGRAERIAGFVAANIIGAGLGVATGVGVYVVPKRGAFRNHVDEYEDAIDRLKQQLDSLYKERVAVAAKVGTGSPLPSLPMPALPPR